MLFWYIFPYILAAPPFQLFISALDKCDCLCQSYDSLDIKEGPLLLFILWLFPSLPSLQYTVDPNNTFSPLLLLKSSLFLISLLLLALGDILPPGFIASWKHRGSQGRSLLCNQSRIVDRKGVGEWRVLFMSWFAVGTVATIDMVIEISTCICENWNKNKTFAKKFVWSEKNKFLTNDFEFEFHPSLILQTLTCLRTRTIKHE